MQKKNVPWTWAGHGMFNTAIYGKSVMFSFYFENAKCHKILLIIIIMIIIIIIIIIIIMLTLFQEDNIFATDASLTYGP